MGLSMWNIFGLYPIKTGHLMGFFHGISRGMNHSWGDLYGYHGIIVPISWDMKPLFGYGSWLALHTSPVYVYFWALGSVLEWIGEVWTRWFCWDGRCGSSPKSTQLLFRLHSPYRQQGLTSSLQALVWVYDTERYPFYQAGAARTRASNSGVLVWGTLDPGSFLEVHCKSKRCSS